MDDINWTEFITEFGIVGILIMNLLMFLKGKIWPEAMVEKMLESQLMASEQAARTIAIELGEKMKNGVAEGMAIGIAEGYLKINKTRGGG